MEVLQFVVERVMYPGETRCDQNCLEITDRKEIVTDFGTKMGNESGKATQKA